VHFDLVTRIIAREMRHLQHVNDAAGVAVTPFDKLMQNLIEVRGPQPRPICFSLREFRFACAHGLQSADVFHVRRSGHEDNRSSIEVVWVFNETSDHSRRAREMIQRQEKWILVESTLNDPLQDTVPIDVQLAGRVIPDLD